MCVCGGGGGGLEIYYSLFAILLGKVVSFKHATQIPAREVLPVKAINMHVFLCFFEGATSLKRKH